MNEENQISYYAVIPATVRYDKELKANEKLLYGEITALSNRNGYCYAKNRYFAKLYDVSIETVSRWLSHLQNLGYIEIEIQRNNNKEVISRNIYIIDIPSPQKNQYPYCQNNQYPYIQKNHEGINKKVKDNNIKYNIDDLFYLIINNSDELNSDFKKIIEKLDFNYKEEHLSYMQEDKITMIKNIIYVLYDLYNNKYDSLLLKISRESLINLYILAEEHNPDNLLSYYKKTIINNSS